MVGPMTLALSLACPAIGQVALIGAALKQNGRDTRAAVQSGTRHHGPIAAASVGQAFRNVQSRALQVKELVNAHVLRSSRLAMQLAVAVGRWTILALAAQCAEQASRQEM